MHLFHFYSCLSNLRHIIFILVHFLKTFPTDFEITMQFCFFILILIFSKKTILLGHVSTFFKLRSQTRKNGAKNKKNVKSKCVLDLNFAPINESMFLIFFKKGPNSWSTTVQLLFKHCLFVHCIWMEQFSKAKYEMGLHHTLSLAVCLTFSLGVQMCTCTHKNSCLVSITVGIHTPKKFEHPEYIGSSQKIETGKSPFPSFISQIRWLEIFTRQQRRRD